MKSVSLLLCSVLLAACATTPAPDAVPAEQAREEVSCGGIAEPQPVLTLSAESVQALLAEGIAYEDIMALVKQQQANGGSVASDSEGYQTQYYAGCGAY